MSARNGARMTPAKLVEQAFQQHGFASVDAYRYKLGAIRVRSVDDRFAGKPYFRRLNLVKPVLHELPPELQQAISLIVLISAEELADPSLNHAAAMNRAFENRTPMGV